jgi:hypothetical protein
VTATTLRYVKPDAYRIGPPAAVPAYFAFAEDSGALHAFVYDSEGGWYSDRGELAFAGSEWPGATNGVCIATDPAELVGDGSLAWRSETGSLIVWDVEGEASYTYDAAAGVQVSAPVYRAGWLYWLEMPETSDDNEFSAAIKRSRCDLTSVSTLATFTVETDVASYEWSDGGQAAISTSGVAFSWLGVDANNNEVAGTFACTCTLGGTSPDHRMGGGGESGIAEPLGLDLGLAAAAGDCVGLSGLALQAMAFDLDDLAAVARWPTSGEWAVSQAWCSGATADGTGAVVVGDSDDDRVLIRAAVTATSGNPTARLTVGDHPEHEFPPSLLYPME